MSYAITCFRASPHADVHVYLLSVFFHKKGLLMQSLHLSILYCRFKNFKNAERDCPKQSLSLYRYYFSVFKSLNYSMISVTTPEPTVLPPSRIANLSPSSIAILWISSISITTLSPGMHISVPSGSCSAPVISVVLK